VEWNLKWDKENEAEVIEIPEWDDTVDTPAPLILALLVNWKKLEGFLTLKLRNGHGKVGTPPCAAPCSSTSAFCCGNCHKRLNPTSNWKGRIAMQPNLGSDFALFDAEVRLPRQKCNLLRFRDDWDSSRPFQREAGIGVKVSRKGFPQHLEKDLKVICQAIVAARDLDTR
jgi:hypothetical protein